MKVVKRSGKLEDMSLEKISYRIKQLCYELTIDHDIIVLRVAQSLHDGISTSEIDEESARIAINIADHPDYAILGARIIISNMHKNTNKSFVTTMKQIHASNPSLLSEEFMKLVEKHGPKLQSTLLFSRDEYFDYFGYKTLEKSYLLKADGKIVERPQHLYMRIALALFKDSIDHVIVTYKYLSEHLYTHATPTMYNAGTTLGSLSSCFLLGTEDSVSGIFETMSDCAKISKLSGGIGLHVSNIRAKGSKIRGTNGISDGIVPMLRVYNAISLYIDQGGGKRKGSIACFVKDTKVFTTSGVKNIQDVEIGDLVVTHKNRVKHVVQVHKNPLEDRKIYKLSIKGNKDIYVTGNHEIWSFYGNKSSSSLGWNTIEELKEIMDKEPCYAMMPSGSNIDEKSTSFTGKYYITDTETEIIKTWDINKDFAYFLGIWLSIGYILEDNEGITGIGFNVCSDDSELITNIEAISRDMFECSSCYLDGELQMKSVLVGEIFSELCRMYSYHGKNLPIMVFDWSRDLVDDLLSGLTATNSTTVGLCNEELATQIFQLCRNNGIRATFINNNTLSIMKPNMTNESCFKISSITECNRDDEYVYTLGVEEDHSYTVEGIIVKNCYLEPWHADVFDFIDAKKNQGDEKLRARDLFYAMFIPDLFMKCVQNDADWYLMCPDESPGLNEVYGDEFDTLYNEYIEKGLYRKKIKARELMDKIAKSQIETGVPYVSYKDHANKKSNQKNIGIIKSSNLCQEIFLVSDDKSYSVCNLASIALSKFVKNKQFQFHELIKVAKFTVISMNKVIDCNYYSLEKTKKTDCANRPLGIGIQGLMDVYFMMDLPFNSPEAILLNKQIFETLYYGLITSSIELAKIDGPYETFKGSPFSEGKLQFDLWKEYSGIDLDSFLTMGYPWNQVRSDLRLYGIRNSTLTTLMPTASSASVLGNFESFENPVSCYYRRSTLSGEFAIINKYLVRKLLKLGLWNQEMKQDIILNDGSIQNINRIPEDIREIYKTVWEIPQKQVLNQCRDRAVFIDQSISMNVYLDKPTISKVASMLMYGWKLGLKTGCYYLRSRAVTSAAKVTIDATKEQEQKNIEYPVCNIDNPDCESCSA